MRIGTGRSRGLLAFVTNYIPNVGFIIGPLPPTILALLDHNVGIALAVVIIYCVINIVLQSVIQPRVVGNTVGLGQPTSVQLRTRDQRSPAGRK